MSKWINNGGPRKTKLAVKAIEALSRMSNMFRELSGVQGGEERSYVYSMPLGGAPAFPEFHEKWKELGEQFNWTLTNDNHEEVLKAAIKAANVLKDKLPIVDKRITPEEAAERAERAKQREAEDEKRRNALKAVVDQIEAIKPKWATRYVWAAYYVDKSDSMVDYFHASCERMVLIGFLRGNRESLASCRELAGKFEPTADLVNADKAKTEQRPGHGWPTMWVGHGGSYSTGWRVYSTDDVSAFGTLEIAPHLLSQEKADGSALAPESPDEIDAEVNAQYDIVETIHTKKGFTMFLAVPQERLSKDAFNVELERAKQAGGWYSRKWGKTPGGFAFKERDKAEAFVG